MDGSEELAFPTNAQMPEMGKELDIAEILRENPEVLNMIASLPFINATKEDTPEDSDTASNSRSSADMNIGDTGSARKSDWFVCFEGASVLATALAASLNVISKCNSGGYEYYECLNRLRFKCNYRVRMRRLGGMVVCEESGVHRHKADTQVPLSSTGLPRSMREIVDESFRENWTYMERQQRLSEEASRLGIDMNTKTNRQIDNRLSYLRRTKNIRQMQQIEQTLSTSTEDHDKLNESTDKLTSVTDHMIPFTVDDVKRSSQTPE